jgi:DNA ligase-1
MYNWVMEFKEFAVYLEKLEKTSSRIEITKILSELFDRSSANEIEKIVYLVLGQLGPKYEGKVLNLADKMMLRVIAKAGGKEIKEVLGVYKKTGDIGDTVFIILKNAPKTSKNLSVTEVFERLDEIVKDTGEGSQERKIEKMSQLIKNLDVVSAKYVSRIPMGRLRLGFSDKTVLDALSWMARGDKSAKEVISKAYQVLPDPGILAKNIKKLGVEKASKNITPAVGIPVEPMLAQRLKSPAEMIEKMGKVSVEPKLDGLRLMLHFKRGGGEKGKDLVKAFTRNLNETSWMFPELYEIGKELRANEVILDCEAVGLDKETRLMANFQTTMTRRRKHDIEKVAAKTAIEFFVFDILLKDKQNLMNKPYLERRKTLEATINNPKRLKVVDYQLTNDPLKIEEVYKEKIKLGLEGVIVKKVDAIYVPGRTGFRWVKMKQVESARGKLSDTVDCVVMGYSTGKGKRAGFGLGQFLVGVKDKDKIKTTTKIGTGLSDEQFRELKKRLTRLEVTQKPKSYEVSKNYTPDFWVSPSLVVEIAADEISISPAHTAGLALRFPRLVKLRDDKSPNEATTLNELKKLFELQKS